MNVENLLPRLQLVRPTRGGWIAKCPSHEDRSPSLSIGVSGEKILLHCFAGCPTDAVCAALKIRMSDLFSGTNPTCQPEPRCLRTAKHGIAGLRSRLTLAERERPTTVVLASLEYPDPAIARALALAVEGEIVQVVLKGRRV